MTSCYRPARAYFLVFLVMALTGLGTTTARAARLGHPQYSAAAATTAQRQVNLVCDPVAAETGSTSTLYQTTVTSLNTITAEPGFQLDEIDVLINDGEETFPQQFILPAGTTTFILVPAVEVAVAAAAPAGTYYGSLEGTEEGAVQVFWSPLTSTVVSDGAVKSNAVPAGGDVNTHFITFDELATTGTATFVNYANGNPKFPVYFTVDDGYSGPGFSYTAAQILSSKATVCLAPQKTGGKCSPIAKK